MIPESLALFNALGYLAITCLAGALSGTLACLVLRLRWTGSTAPVILPGGSSGSGNSALTQKGRSVAPPNPFAALLLSLTAPREVSKSYSQTMPCDLTSQQVMTDVESNFSAFANYFNPGLLTNSSVTFNPAPGALTPGESIPITVNISNSEFGIGYTLNTSVNVVSATSGSLTFSTVPGHLLYPAQITFSAYGTGNIVTFDINLSGTLSGGNVIAFNAGGSAFEDTQWHAFLQQVQTLCNK